MMTDSGWTLAALIAIPAVSSMLGACAAAWVEMRQRTNPQRTGGGAIPRRNTASDPSPHESPREHARGRDPGQTPVHDPRWIKFVKMTDAQHDLLRSALLTPCGREHKIFLFLGRTASGVTVSDIIVPENTDYAIRTPVSVRMTHHFTHRMLIKYENSIAAGLMDFHSHPFSHRAEFSAIDDQFIPRMIEAAERHNPGGFVMRGVTGQAEDGFAIDVFRNGQFQRVPEVRIVGQHGTRTIFSHHCVQHGANGEHVETDERYSRTAMIRTSAENGRIAGARVVLFGAGGLGWSLGQNLAAIGILNLTVVDDDVVETVNLNRLIGATTADVGRPKVARLASMLTAHDPRRKIKTITQAFPGAESIEALQHADLVVVGVDNHPSREAVLRLCVRHHVPAIDCGTSITLDETRTLEAERNGHVWLFVPGRHVCWQQMGLTGPDLWATSLREARRQAGYVIGDPRQSPGSVQTLNNVVAAAAVGIAEAFLCGRGVSHNMLHYRQEYSPELTQELRAYRVRVDAECPLCGAHGVAGQGGNPFEEDDPSPIPELPFADVPANDSVDEREAELTEAVTRGE